MGALPSGIFDGLTKIITLDLSWNNFSELPTGIFSHLSNLTALSLAHNQLQSLSTGDFYHLTRLQLFDIACNQLTMLPVDLFEKMTDMQTLSLGENYLSGDHSAHVYALTRLTWLNVSSNHALELLQKPWIGLGLKLLDVSFTSVKAGASMCNEGLVLYLKGMQSNSLQLLPMVTACSGRVDILDLSGNDGLDHPGLLESAMLEAQKIIPITRDDQSPLSADVYTIMQLRDLPVACTLVQEGRYRSLPQSMAGATNSFYNVLPSIVYKCRCSSGYSLDAHGRCFVYWSSGRIAAVTLGAFGMAALIAGLAVFRWYRRRRRRFYHTIGVQERLLKDAETDLDMIRQSWQIRWSDVELGECIGEGGFGNIHAAMWMFRRVACKRLKKELPDREFAAFEAEAAAMSGMRHPNIVSFFGAGVDDDGRGFLVVELMASGSLRFVLDAKDTLLKWSTRLRFCADISSGMLFLHSRQPPMLHRDLKADNVLLDDRWVAKVSDFGTLRKARHSC